MYNVWAFFTRRSRFGVVLILAIAFLGFSAISGIPKESAPEVDVPIGVVSTVLPGASPADVEKLVTNVLEDPLRNRLDDLKDVTSSSGEGVSSITVEFEANANLEKSIKDLRDEVDTLVQELPDEAEDPRVIEIDFGAQPVVTVTVSADVPNELLFQLGERLEEELENVKGVSSVSVGGVDDREVQVLIKREALETFGLTVTDVTQAIAGADIALPVGSIQFESAEYPVRFAGDITDTANIANIAITSLNGAPVYVRDVAEIFDAREEPTTFARTSLDGNPSVQSISFDVFKGSGANITDVSAATRDRLDELQQPGELLDGLQVLIMFDNGELLLDDLTTLTRSGLQTVFLVTLILAIAVGWREALIAAISIPLSFLTAFIFLNNSGNTLNFVSLFALILSIGIIVDSTIVIVEGINRRLRKLSAFEGESAKHKTEEKSQAALKTVKEFHVPLTAGTLTTVAVFAPLLIVSGVTGEFIKSIPFTIIFVLSASLLVALGFVPLFATKLLRRGSAVKTAFAEKRDYYVECIESWYRRYLTDFLASREAQNTFIVTLIILFVLALSLPAIGAVRVVFFEDDNSDYMYIEAELPTGTVLEQTDLEVRKAEEILYAVPEIESFVTTVGRTSAFSDPFGSPASASRFATSFITLSTERERETSEIVDDVRERMSKINTSSIRVDQLSDGPPSLPPVTITLSGEDFADLENSALQVESILKGIPGTVDITSTVKNNTNEFVLEVDRAKAASLGVSSGQIALALRTSLFGSTVTEIKQLGEDIDVVAKVAFENDPFTSNRTGVDALREITVATQNGPVPLSSFVTATIAPSRASILHEDGERIARVSSRVAEGATALEVSREFEAKLAAANIPDGITVSVGGESEDIDQSFRDMFTALLIGMISMFAILILQFDSFRFAGYVLMIVPLSLIGVFGGLMITGNPLSFPSIMGFIALSGIVVNNSIILIDTINNLRRKKHQEKGGTLSHEEIQEVVLEGAVSRLRPVVLTALTTVIGITPLLWAAALWVPLAYAIMFGLSFSTIITLLLVPAIYVHWPGKLSY